MHDDEVKYQSIGETVIYSIDFTAWLHTGESLSTITSIVSDPTGLTISNQTISGNSVYFTISNPVSCGNYDIVCTVQTSTSEIFITKVKLRVR